VAKAIKAYAKALEYPQSRVYAFALYKTAWCYYNLGDYQQAITTFKAVIARGEAAEAKQKASASTFASRTRR